MADWLRRYVRNVLRWIHNVSRTNRRDALHLKEATLAVYLLGTIQLIMLPSVSSSMFAIKIVAITSLLLRMARVVCLGLFSHLLGHLIASQDL